MLQLKKANILSTLSGIDMRVAALVLTCLIAFYMGLRLEKVNTQKVRLEWKTEQLNTAAAMQAAIIDSNERAVTASALVEKLNAESSKREKERTAEYSNLLARYNAERVRLKTVYISSEGNAPNTSVGVPAAPGGIISEQAGEDIISLTAEADKYLGGLRDAQVYIKTIKDLCK